jgi:hypothetical protein
VTRKQYIYEVEKLMNRVVSIEPGEKQTFLAGLKTLNEKFSKSWFERNMATIWQFIIYGLTLFPKLLKLVKR